MSPDTIPVLFCGALCLLPFVMGLGGFNVARMIARRVPRLQKYQSERDGRPVTILEWSIIEKEKRVRPEREEVEEL